MEIPYTIEARPDTGVYNAKLGVWLFLASEVMLFGALFSSYILLRVGAPPGTWPHGWLNVPLGTLNTCLLSLSAITTLMAWVACKAGNFGKFKLFHGLTIVLALTFLCIKSYEYNDKFHHYQILKTDGTYVDGHFHGAVYSQDGTTDQVEEKHYRGKTFAEAGKNYSLVSVTLHGFAAQELSEITQPDPAHPHTMDEVETPAAQIKKIQNYGPWLNTYLAIYFVLTGLHALHILGGVLVIGYMWGPGSKMFFTNHEQFTNRIEVSGLFWHFVDLVWIFLFPVLYLM